MRHTLFKILVCICLFFLVIIVLIVSLPSVVTNSVFGLDGSMVDMENPTTLLESYNDLAADISAVVEEGYDAALAKVEQIIEDGGITTTICLWMHLSITHRVPPGTM